MNGIALCSSLYILLFGGLIGILLGWKDGATRRGRMWIPTGIGFGTIASIPYPCYYLTTTHTHPIVVFNWTMTPFAPSLAVYVSITLIAVLVYSFITELHP